VKDPPGEVSHLDGGKCFDVKIGIERTQAAQEIQIPILLQRRMQAADHVDFGNSQGKRFRDGPDNLVTRVLKGMGVALLGGESTELAGEHTNIGIIDVPIVDVGRVIAVLSLAHNVGNHSKPVKIVRTIQSERVSL
jgi:hypothetical protein